MYFRSYGIIFCLSECNNKYNFQNMSENQLTGFVSINHKYIYNTTVGMEISKRPELIDHKHCNILFALNTNLITEQSFHQDVMSTTLNNEQSNVLWMDIGACDNILMALNTAANMPVNYDNRYLMPGDVINKDCTLKEFQNKYDAVAPFQKLVLDKILEDRDIFIDFTKSLPLSGPVRKFINILTPKAITAINPYHSVTNNIIHSQNVAVLVDGITSEQFPLLLPAKRCFYIDDTSNIPKTIYMVIAPYKESIIPSKCSPTNEPKEIFSNVGISTLNFTVGKDNVLQQVVQYPSYAISYIIVPSQWTYEAVISEVTKRCNHYTQCSNIDLESYREIAVLSLGFATHSLLTPSIATETIGTTDMYKITSFIFYPGMWHYSIFKYKRDISRQTGEMLTTDILKEISVQKTIPVTHLSARLFRSQMDEYKQHTTENKNLLKGYILEKFFEYFCEKSNTLHPFYKKYFDSKDDDGNALFNRRSNELSFSSVIDSLLPELVKSEEPCTKKTVDLLLGQTIFEQHFKEATPSVLYAYRTWKTKDPEEFSKIIGKVRDNINMVNNIYTQIEPKIEKCKNDEKEVNDLITETLLRISHLDNEVKYYESKNDSSATDSIKEALLGQQKSLNEYKIRKEQIQETIKKLKNDKSNAILETDRNMEQLLEHIDFAVNQANSLKRKLDDDSDESSREQYNDKVAETGKSLRMKQKAKRMQNGIEQVHREESPNKDNAELISFNEPVIGSNQVYDKMADSSKQENVKQANVTKDFAIPKERDGAKNIISDNSTTDSIGNITEDEESSEFSYFSEIDGPYESDASEKERKQKKVKIPKKRVTKSKDKQKDLMPEKNPITSHASVIPHITVPMLEEATDQEQDIKQDI